MDLRNVSGEYEHTTLINTVRVWSLSNNRYTYFASTDITQLYESMCATYLSGHKRRNPRTSELLGELGL